MKFYTLTYDCNRPTKQQINVPTNTDFKVGVKIFRNNEEQMLEPTEVTLGNLSADPEKTNGYVTFTQATGDEAKMEISQLSINHTPLNTTFDLAINTFKSQQGDIDIVGDTSGFYTKGEVDVMLSAKADVAELTAYATNESLSAYATQTDLASKVTNLSSVSGIMKISQADYDALSAGGTADVNTLYVIVD